MDTHFIGKRSGDSHRGRLSRHTASPRNMNSANQTTNVLYNSWTMPLKTSCPSSKTSSSHLANQTSSGTLTTHNPAIFTSLISPTQPAFSSGNPPIYTIVATQKYYLPSRPISRRVMYFTGPDIFRIRPCAIRLPLMAGSSCIPMSVRSVITFRGDRLIVCHRLISLEPVLSRAACQHLSAHK